MEYADAAQRAGRLFNPIYLTCDFITAATGKMDYFIIFYII